MQVPTPVLTCNLKVYPYLKCRCNPPGTTPSEFIVKLINVRGPLLLIRRFAYYPFPLASPSPPPPPLLPRFHTPHAPPEPPLVHPLEQLSSLAQTLLTLHPPNPFSPSQCDPPSGNTNIPRNSRQTHPKAPGKCGNTSWQCKLATQSYYTKTTLTLTRHPHPNQTHLTTPPSPPAVAPPLNCSPRQKKKKSSTIS